MTDQPPEKLSLLEGTVWLYRNVKFMHGTQEFGAGDHMIVEHVTGNEEDVVVIQEGGKAKVKRLVKHLEIQTSSLGVPATSTVSHSLADVDTDTERRLLGIYKRFPKQAA
jgi:hypothetical protein